MVPLLFPAFLTDCFLQTYLVRVFLVQSCLLYVCFSWDPTKSRKRPFTRWHQPYLFMGKRHLWFTPQGEFLILKKGCSLFEIGILITSILCPFFHIPVWYSFFLMAFLLFWVLDFRCFLVLLMIEFEIVCFKFFDVLSNLWEETLFRYFKTGSQRFSFKDEEIGAKRN